MDFENTLLKFQKQILKPKFETQVEGRKDQRLVRKYR